MEYCDLCDGEGETWVECVGCQGTGLPGPCDYSQCSACAGAGGWPGECDECGGDGYAPDEADDV